MVNASTARSLSGVAMVGESSQCLRSLLRGPSMRTLCWWEALFCSRQFAKTLCVPMSMRSYAAVLTQFSHTEADPTDYNEDQASYSERLSCVGICVGEIWKEPGLLAMGCISILDVFNRLIHTDFTIFPHSTLYGRPCVSNGPWTVGSAQLYHHDTIMYTTMCTSENCKHPHAHIVVS